MKLTTYLNFGGNCREVLGFDEKHLGAKIGAIMTHGQMPGATSVPDEIKDLVMHVRFTIGDTQVMASDARPGLWEPMRSAYLALSLDSSEEADRVYAALSDGAEIFMKMDQTFFADRFAMLRDKFGISWMVSHEKAKKPQPTGQ